MVLSVDMLNSLVEILDIQNRQKRDVFPTSNMSVCELQKQHRYEQMNPWIMALVYSVIFILSTFGNSIVIFVMCFRARTQSVTSMLITNLAISDLLLCFTSLWITPLYFFLLDWPFGGSMFGSTMCHLFPMIQSVTVFNSALTLLTISVDRYYSVCRMENTRRSFNLTPKTCTFVIFSIWTISFILGIPYGLNMQLVKRECGMRCTEVWGADTILKNMEIKIIYGFITVILQFIIPLVFIGYSYLKIYLYLKKQCKQSNFRLRVVSTKKNTLFRMLFIMVTAFATCWAPLNILNIMRDLHLIRLIKSFNTKFIIAHAIAMSASLANPLIYAFMNWTFRDEFSRIAPELHIKLCNTLCHQKRKNEEKAANQQLGRPLLDLNHHIERVALKQQKDGTAEMRRNSSNSSLNLPNRPKSLKMAGKISTSETTPNQNSPVEF